MNAVDCAAFWQLFSLGGSVARGTRQNAAPGEGRPGDAASGTRAVAPSPRGWRLPRAAPADLTEGFWLPVKISPHTMKFLHEAKILLKKE
jgi:hypothetical protein